MPSRLFARFYDPFMHRFEPPGVRAARGPMLAGLSGQVLEIGVGTGAGFPHYPPDATVTAIDYSPHMVRRARRKAQQAAIDVTIEQANVERLPFDDAQFDNAFATLVFCSVGSPRAGLAEIRRVTKPGGSVRFLEHVRSDRPRTRRLQNALTPFWRRLNDGCRLNRDTVAAIRDAGFTIESVEDVPGTPGFVPMKLVHARVPLDG